MKLHIPLQKQSIRKRKKIMIIKLMLLYSTNINFTKLIIIIFISMIIKISNNIEISFLTY